MYLFDMNTFVKSHGLGNAYLILDKAQSDFELTPQRIQRLCHPDFGIGSDGILLKVDSEQADFGLRIFNPDGSEAEKSGNGVRIFGKYLFDRNLTRGRKFSLETLGGRVDLEVLEALDERASLLRAGMGRAEFKTARIPANFMTPEVLDYPLIIKGKTLHVNSVSVGNPHCVVFLDDLRKADIRKYGPLLEVHPAFPNKVNVQFVRVISSSEVEMLIWERGAGYTLASGSSACAVAAIGHKRGMLGKDVILKMPGGTLQVQIGDDWHLDLIGPVEEICEGAISKELIGN